MLDVNSRLEIVLKPNIKLFITKGFNLSTLITAAIFIFMCQIHDRAVGVLFFNTLVRHGISLNSTWHLPVRQEDAHQ